MTRIDSVQVLVYRPEGRLVAVECLAHPFFEVRERETSGHIHSLSLPGYGSHPFSLASLGTPSHSQWGDARLESLFEEQWESDEGTGVG